MSLLAVMKSYKGAERVARTIVGVGANHPRARRELSS